MKTLTKPKRLTALVFIIVISLNITAKAQKNSIPDNIFGTWGHGLVITTDAIKSMPFIRGWNFTFKWRDIEPEKGVYNWEKIDEQFKIAAENNLYIGFMIWVGQHSPSWVYEIDEVPKVVTTDKLRSVPYYPYYLDPNYKKDYMNMLEATAEHIKTLKPKIRTKILFWMSAEGTSGDVTPYKGSPIEDRYNISDDDWLSHKTDAWDFMYQFGESIKPKLNILINPANNGMYFDYLVENFTQVWFKAGSLAHTFQFDGELEYFNRLKRVIKSDNNTLANRFRGESEEVQEVGWFKQSPQQNNFALVASCLHIGLDILNVREGITEAVGNNNYPFLFYNKYAGHRNPTKSPGAFCMMRDVLDVADTIRFPEREFGNIYNKEKMNASLENIPKSVVTDGDEIKKIKLANISPVRIQHILTAFSAFGAKGGTTLEEDKIIYKNDVNLKPKLRKENLRTDLQDKYNNDLGINLIPGNYCKFLEQYSPNTTSRGYWRVGPIDQPYGRYARGFDAKAGMKEMFFALDEKFFNNNALAHEVKISITYFDQGNGSWSMNYYNGKNKTKSFEVQCTNTNRWITKTIWINDFHSKKLMGNKTDLTLKYISGDNTLFSLIEIERKNNTKNNIRTI